MGRVFSEIFFARKYLSKKEASIFHFLGVQFFHSYLHSLRAHDAPIRQLFVLDSAHALTIDHAGACALWNGDLRAPTSFSREPVLRESALHQMTTSQLLMQRSPVVTSAQLLRGCGGGPHFLLTCGVDGKVRLHRVDCGTGGDGKDADGLWRG